MPETENEQNRPQKYFHSVVLPEVKIFGIIDPQTFVPEPRHIYCAACGAEVPVTFTAEALRRVGGYGSWGCTCKTIIYFRVG